MRAPERLVLLGHPVKHSLSPRFQNAALEAAGIAARYEALEVDPMSLDLALAVVRKERAAGNVTVPFKERVFEMCDITTPLAARVQAVNTFWVDDAGQLIGDNTDVGGFDASVRTILETAPRDLTVGVLGAGGAAAAVLAAIESWPNCYAHVYNRTPERARILCERFSAFAQPVDDVGVIVGAQLIVNATTIGLRDDTNPIDPASILDDTAVVDLVYRPGRTAFVQRLVARGIRAVDGLEMLVEQGALAFERWFDRAPDRGVMWRALENL
jgi:shikimate dehydrogenase